jgi:hypothetical protein
MKRVMLRSQKQQPEQFAKNVEFKKTLLLQGNVSTQREKADKNGFLYV